jgi:hypothetical protein
MALKDALHLFGWTSVLLKACCIIKVNLLVKQAHLGGYQIAGNSLWYEAETTRFSIWVNKKSRRLETGAMGMVRIPSGRIGRAQVSMNINRS